MSGRRAWRAPAPQVVDALVALGVAGALALVVALAQPGAGAAPDAVAYLFAAALGGVLLVRRRHPRAVLWISVGLTFTYYVLELPVVGVAVPVAAALFSAAEAGAGRSAVAAGALVLVVAQGFRLRDDPQPAGYVLGHETVANLALVAAAVALGHVVHVSRIRAAQRERIEALTEEQHRRERDLWVQRERERISRDLHDTVGHSLSVIALHAGVGLDAVPDDPEAAAGALTRVRTESSRSLAELRALLRVLRTDDGRRDSYTLAGVASLADRARTTGLEVDVSVDIEEGVLAGPVDGAAYRVVQEALTNVLRHSGASLARVQGVVKDGVLLLSVSDDGTGAPADRGPGHGLTGMAERVRLLGGTLDARSSAGGFVVDAALPVALPEGAA